MTDKELLEKAAKAAGIELDWDVPPNSPPWRITGDGEERGPASPWDPENDDGDALRLAVKLRAFIDHQADGVFACINSTEAYASEPYRDDPYAATRRAIVRAAAQMAKE